MTAGSLAFQLEGGEVARIEDSGFRLSESEMAHVTRGLGEGRSKNVSFDPTTGEVRGAQGDAPHDSGIAGLLKRYAEWARELVRDTAPEYGPHLRPGRTSLRTRDAGAPALSVRKDDRRLHADAFPSTPTGGARILRVFTNFNPDGEPRKWRIGEPFETYANRWVHQIRLPWPGESWLLAHLGVTRAYRTPYDALMLGLHDRGKLDDRYQRTSPVREASFPAGSSWIVFTDGVVHAAESGRYALEQTFYLPIEAMVDPAASPLRVLERLTGRPLVQV